MYSKQHKSQNKSSELDTSVRDILDNPILDPPRYQSKFRIDQMRLQSKKKSKSCEGRIVIKKKTDQVQAKSRKSVSFDRNISMNELNEKLDAMTSCIVDIGYGIL